MPVLRYLHRHHVGVLALVLVVVMSGSAYAATRLAKNSVGSPQVRNNSLTGADVRDRSLSGQDVRDATLTGADVRNGSLGEADLSPAVARTDVVFRRVPVGTTSTLFDDPTLGRVTFACFDGGRLALNSQIPGSAATSQGPVNLYASGTDLLDGSPVGAAEATAAQGAPGGGVGIDAAGWAIARFETVLADESQVVHVELQPSTGSPCRVRAVITRDTNADGTIEAPTTRRRAGGGSGSRCIQQVGAATCRVG